MMKIGSTKNLRQMEQVIRSLKINEEKYLTKFYRGGVKLS